MTLEVVWTPTAAREYDNLGAHLRERIDTGLYLLAVHARGDVERLKAKQPPEYRLRVGEYRVRFALPAGTDYILVLHVRPRGSAYKD